MDDDISGNVGVNQECLSVYSDDIRDSSVVEHSLGRAEAVRRSQRRLRGGAAREEEEG